MQRPHLLQHGQRLPTPLACPVLVQLVVVAMMLLLQTAAGSLQSCRDATDGECSSGGSGPFRGHAEEDASLLQMRRATGVERTGAGVKLHEARVALEAAPASNVGESGDAEWGTCKRTTTTSCDKFPCPNRFGPVQCALTVWGKKCQCMPGFCLNQGTCVSSLSSVKADVFPVNSMKPAFPPRQSRVKVGVCSSGGGNRAVSFAMGIFRALTELGLTSNIDMLSTVSGSSWFSSIYMYARQPDLKLLGKPTVPATLTLRKLKKEASLIGATAATRINGIMFNNLIKGTPTSQIWQRSVGEVYLEPFGLDDPATYLAGSKGDVARIKRMNPRLLGAKFNLPRTDRPGAFVMLGTMLAPEGFTPSVDNAVGLQMSPGFVGSPFYPNMSTVTYVAEDPEKAPGSQPTLTRLVGGGFVESFAFGGAAPSSAANQMGGPSVEMGAPPVPFTLGDAIGIGSLSLQVADTFAAIGLDPDPIVNYWPVTSLKFPAPQGALRTTFGDGGVIDNIGVMPLLQRGPEKVLWIQASYRPLNRSYDWAGACAGEVAFDPVASGIVDSVAATFGFGDLVTTDTYFASNNQVFSKPGLLPVACAVWDRVLQGKPAVVPFSERVLKNTWWNIDGGYTVEVVLVYLETVQNFVDLLPKETQDEIARGDKGKLANFPIYKTNFQNFVDLNAYTNTQVNLLAAQAEYMVKESRHLIEKVLG